MVWLCRPWRLSSESGVFYLFFLIHSKSRKQLLIKRDCGHSFLVGNSISFLGDMRSHLSHSALLCSNVLVGLRTPVCVCKSLLGYLKVCLLCQQAGSVLVIFYEKELWSFQDQLVCIRCPVQKPHSSLCKHLSIV